MAAMFFSRPPLRLLGVCWLLLPAGAAPAAEALDDSTRVLDAEKSAVLRREIEAFTEATGVRLFVKTVAYIDPGVTLRAASQRARREAAAQGPAALILVDRGKNGLGISHSPELWQRYPLSALVETLRDTLNEASANRDATLEDKLQAACRAWMANIRRLEADRRQATRLLSGPGKPLLFGYAALLGLGGCGMLIFTARRRTQRVEENLSREFPDLVVGQRLGAPYGGGHIAEWHHSGADD